MLYLQRIRTNYCNVCVNMEEEIEIKLRLPEPRRVICLSDAMPDRERWFKGMRVQTHLFGWVTLVSFRDRHCCLKLDEPLEDGTKAVFVTEKTFVKRVPVPLTAKSLTAKEIGVSVEGEVLEYERKMKRKWEKERKRIGEACEKYGYALPYEWKRSLRKFASWCEDQIRQYGHIVDADYLMRHDTSVVGGRSVDDLRFVPDVDIEPGGKDGKDGKGGKKYAMVSRCALMPGSIVTAIINAGKPMVKSVSLWRNSYFVRMRRFGYTYNTCCYGANTRDDAFTWFKDITVQYMEDLIEYYGIRRDSIVCRKLEHIADVYKSLEDMDASPDISTDEYDLYPVVRFGEIVPDGMGASDGTDGTDGTGKEERRKQ